MAGPTTSDLHSNWRAARDAPDSRAGRARSRVAGFGGYLHGLLDRVIAAASTVPTDPVLDMRAFAWTATLRADWQAIRAEAVASLGETAPAASPRQELALWRDGRPLAAPLARCPASARAVGHIPGLAGASFSVLARHTHLPARRGLTKGLITCHLGLVVPRDGDVRMRVGDRVVRWAEGQTLVFDDSYDHELWNEADDARIVLRIQVERPMRQPGRSLCAFLLNILGRSPPGR